jgi:transposase-like protein
MTTAQALTQTELDAQAYDAYIRNGENRAATARELGIGATTAYDRIKRHLARQAQDAASEPEQPQAETPAEPQADVFAEILAIDPEMRAIEEAAAAFADKPVTEDPDESVVALLEDGEPEQEQESPEPVAVVPAVVKAAAAGLPEGVITPGQFRDLLIAEGLAGDDLRSKTVCDWVKRAKAFPARFYGADGTVYDQQQKADGKVITKTGVDAAAARQWFIDRAARQAAKVA